MIEVHPNLFVGDQADYDSEVAQREGWAVVHACKEPYHRRALGYATRGAPKDHPEYLVARRGQRLILNMVDAPRPEFFDKGMMDAALDFIGESLEAGQKVLVHCNQGESRSPSLALLFMAARLGVLPDESLQEAEVAFREVYPNYNPKAGIRGHLQRYWEVYCEEGMR